MLPQEIKDRIEKDGVDFFTGPYTKISVYNKSNRIVNAYVAGAEREAERAQGLVDFLHKMLQNRRGLTVAQEEDIREALHNYNNPK
jgi:hypothetical protein